MNFKKFYHQTGLFIILCSAALLAACNGSNLEDNIKDDPYGGGKAPLGVGFLLEPPSPASAYPRDSVTYKTKGLLQWCDPASGRYNFKFYISDEETEIVTATDSTITVKIPENLSSGIAHIILEGQVFYGPRLVVLGNIRIDREYGIKKGSSGPIYNYLERYQMERNYYFVGDFLKIFDASQAFSCIALVDSKGVHTGKWVTGFNLDPGEGAGVDVRNPTAASDFEYYLNSISYFSDQKVLLSGKFSRYGKGGYYMNNITVTNTNVGSDKVSMSLPSKYYASNVNVDVPVFNGGTLEAPVRSFVTSNNKVVAVGNITRYCKIDYLKSFAEEIAFAYTPVSCVLRMEKTGELDVNYRPNETGVVGAIRDACMDETDGVIIVGTFNVFDGRQVHNIVKLDANGRLDETFMRNIGTGANGPVQKIRYNKTLRKAIIVGQFSEFNNTPCQGVVVINSDGTRDTKFNVQKMEGGLPNFACILNNGKIIISGTFTKYEGVTRRGFLMLDPDGKSTQRFNVPGIFMGELYQVVETRTTTNANGLLLLGSFYRFDGEPVSNAVMIEIDYD